MNEHATKVWGNTDKLIYSTCCHQQTDLRCTNVWEIQFVFAVCSTVQGSDADHDRLKTGAMKCGGGVCFFGATVQTH